MIFGGVLDMVGGLFFFACFRNFCTPDPRKFHAPKISTLKTPNLGEILFFSLGKKSIYVGIHHPKCSKNVSETSIKPFRLILKKFVFFVTKNYYQFFKTFDLSQQLFTMCLSMWVRCSKKLKGHLECELAFLEKTMFFYTLKKRQIWFKIFSYGIFGDPEGHMKKNLKR